MLMIDDLLDDDLDVELRCYARGVWESRWRRGFWTAGFEAWHLDIPLLCSVAGIHRM